MKLLQPSSMVTESVCHTPFTNIFNTKNVNTETQLLLHHLPNLVLALLQPLRNMRY